MNTFFDKLISLLVKELEISWKISGMCIQWENEDGYSFIKLRNWVYVHHALNQALTTVAMLKGHGLELEHGVRTPIA